MRLINCLPWILAGVLFAVAGLPVVGAGQVVLLHGIARSSGHMQPVEAALRKSGFEVVNLSYPSTEYSIEGLVDWLQQALKERIDASEPIHFVGYSMGGLLVRALIARDRPTQLGRVVQLAPPNQGSEVADFFRENWFFRRIYGPAGQQLGTKVDLSSLLGLVDYELGVLAGNRSIDPFSSLLIPGEDDGKVSVASTCVAGMRAHCALPVSHTFFPGNPEVHRYTVHFLQTGHFPQND